MKIDLVNALKKPFSDWKKLLIGLVINFIPVVNFIAFGYYLECAKLSLKKKNNLPEWKNFGNLFVKGIFWILIFMIYFVPVVILLFSLGGWKILKVIAADPRNSDMLSVLGKVNLVIFAVVLFVFMYWTYGALVNYARAGKFKNAFDFTYISRKVFTGEYLGAALVFFVLGFILNYLLSFVQFIGPSISSFIAGVIGFTLLGEAFR